MKFLHGNHRMQTTSTLQYVPVLIQELLVDNAAVAVPAAATTRQQW